MKKFLAILLSVLLFATFMAVPAFAADSPSGEVIGDGDGAEGEGSTDSEAPQTGNGALALAVTCTAGAFVVMVASKKRVAA